MLSLILSCEHGGNDIPSDYQFHFKEKKTLLASHRGWDIGALEIANALSLSLLSPLYYSTTSRLLVELNRSLHHPNLFSTISKSFAKEEKKAILKKYYSPYRNTISQVIEKKISQDKIVLHLSVHSFTPELNGNIRNADIGLLYDPKSEHERLYCREWKKQISEISDYKLRYNYPYKGTADGFTTFLRKKFPRNYSGIELEINQKLLIGKESKTKMIKILTDSLTQLIK